MKLPELILSIIKTQRCEYIFGVPGDYNLRFLDYIVKDKQLSWVGNCNELNAGYAADGYARENGFGVLVTTHGVGELSAANAVAGAFSEDVPLLQIVGYPKQSILNLDLPVHHTLANSNKNNFIQSYKPLCCAITLLNEHNYCYEISRVIKEILMKKKPGYIGLPVDLVDLDITNMCNEIEINPYYFTQKVSTSILNNIQKKIIKSKKPVLLIGEDIKKFNWINSVLSFINTVGIPFASASPAKAVISEDHPLFLGMYAGKYNLEGRNKIFNSDCIITIGTKDTDFTTGGFSENQINLKNLIQIRHDYIKISNTIFPSNLDVNDLLERLGSELSKHKITYNRVNNCKAKRIGFNLQKKLEHDTFWTYISSQIIKDNDIIVADTGTSVFGLLDQFLPQKINFYSQLLWASIGYSLPASLGFALANKDKRILLFIGDGAFQLTGQELSTLKKVSSNIIIFLICNEGYTVERAIHGPHETYNDISEWDYEMFARSLGLIHVYKVNSLKCLENIDMQSHQSEPVLIQCFFDKMDIPSLLKEVTDNLKK